MKKKTIAILLLGIVVITFAIITALGGVDFGYHWDEEHTLGLVQHYVRSQEFLPGWYEWPPMLSYVAYAATIPYSFPLEIADYPGYHIREYVIRLVLENPTFVLNARKLLVVVTYLAPLWLLVGVLRREHSSVQAFLAAAFLALSWELNYHSRWIAPDAIMMQFGALVLMCSLLALNTRRYALLWLVLAAAAAALAAAAKYPGAILALAPVTASYWITAKTPRPRLRFLAYTFILGVVCLATFVLVVPGVYAESEQFWATIRVQIAHYSRDHGRQTVSSGAEHLWLMLVYFGAVFFSYYPALALAVTGLVAFGIYAYTKDKQWATLSTLLLFPIAYLLLFSRQSVMFVRNILVVAPFLAVLASNGAIGLYRQIAMPRLRVLAGLAITGLLAMNAYSLWSASLSILMRSTSEYTQRFVQYAASHPHDAIYVSPGVREQLDEAGITQWPANLRSEIQGADLVSVMFYEAMEVPGYWWVNHPGVSPMSFGPQEINLDYYAYWRGDDRILLATPEQARELEFKPEFIP